MRVLVSKQTGTKMPAKKMAPVEHLELASGLCSYTDWYTHGHVLTHKHTCKSPSKDLIIRWVRVWSPWYIYRRPAPQDNSAWTDFTKALLCVISSKMSSECRIFGFRQCPKQPFRKAVNTINIGCDEALRLPSVAWHVCFRSCVICWGNLHLCSPRPTPGFWEATQGDLGSGWDKREAGEAATK